MDLSRLRATLLPPDAAGDVWAAVAVVLAGSLDGPSVLLIRREARPGDPWSGQVACPGGRVTKHDASALDACIRETREEVGLELRPRGEFLGLLTPRSPGNRPGLRVAPFLWHLAEAPPVRPGPEVVKAWYEPLLELPSLDHDVTVSTSRGPLRTRGFVAGEEIIWGFTYRLLLDVIELTRTG